MTDDDRGETIAALVSRMARGERVALAAGHRCSGGMDYGCHERVDVRGASCPSCAERHTRDLRALTLHAAACTLPTGWEHARADRLHGVIEPEFAHVARTWSRDAGNLLLCADTGRGKTTACVAIARRILALATSHALAPVDHAFAAGLRFVSWLDLIEADRQQRMGAGESPVTRDAMRATLLIVDEVGYEDDRRSVHLMRTLIDARGRDSRKRTIATTGKSHDQLVRHYDAAIVRKLIGPGENPERRIVDLTARK